MANGTFNSNINKFQEKILIFKETETLKKLLRKDAPKELLLVSQNKAFVIFRKRETPKFFFIFLELKKLLLF